MNSDEMAGYVPAERSFVRRYFFEMSVSAAVLFGGWFSAWVGFFFVVPGPNFAGGNISDRMFTWDAADYLSVAQHGYGAGPIAPTSFNFFPLQPIIDRTIFWFTHVWPPIEFHDGYVVFSTTAHTRSTALYLAPSLIAGIASIWVFHKLALYVWSDVNSARVSTAAYAAFPGTAYFFSGLPVGITQLMAVLSIYGAVRRRFWWAALFAGVATACGPLNALIALPVAALFLADSWRVRPPSRGLSKGDVRILAQAAGMLLVGESGLLTYMLYLTVKFHSPLKFVSVQSYWGGKGLSHRLIDFFMLRDFNVPYIKQVVETFGFGQNRALVNSLGFAIGIIVLSTVFWGGVITCRAALRIATPDCIILGLFAVAVALGYWWFIVTQVGFVSAPRLTDIAIPSFLALGSIWLYLRSLAVAIVTLCAALSFVIMIMLVAGYPVP